MWTKKYPIDMPADPIQGALELLVNRVEVSNVKKAATDARLVGSDNHRISSMIESGDGLQTARDRGPLIG
jgi:hypothetical protein